MNTGDEGSAGFSTMEMLVAFVVLSLGLGVAVQTISQSAGNLRHSASYQDESLLLRRLLSEELPQLASTYDGRPLKAAGPSWTISIPPLSKASLRLVKASVEVTSGSGSATYTVVLPFSNEAPPPSGQP